MRLSCVLNRYRSRDYHGQEEQILPERGQNNLGHIKDLVERASAVAQVERSSELRATLL